MKMNLLELISRAPTPAPWAEGEKIPWNDPAFSARMLNEHLSQDHDMASRRAAKIDAHVRWIHAHLLRETPSRILDLGCGPGLYASRLARLGHTCTGIDFGPASIRYAQETAQAENLGCTYRLADVRQADFGGGYDLIMFIFGEINTFRRNEALHILRKAHAALADGGTLLLEPHTFEAVRQMGQEKASWSAASGGLFSDRPHLCLTEHFWDAPNQLSTTRIYIVDAETAQTTPYVSITLAYTDEEYRALVRESGFEQITFYPSLTGGVDESQAHLFALVARKQV